MNIIVSKSRTIAGLCRWPQHQFVQCPCQPPDQPDRSAVKADFRYVADEDACVCPAGERLIWRYVRQEGGLVERRYWTNACGSCALKAGKSLKRLAETPICNSSRPSQQSRTVSLQPRPI